MQFVFESKNINNVYFEGYLNVLYLTQNIKFKRMQHVIY